MAGIQANGVSGLDINSLVSQLVAAEASTHQQRITRHEVQVTTKLSALGTFKGAMSAFKSALEPLKNLDVFQTRKATSGSTDHFTVSAGTKAVAGHYDVEVVNVARAHQLASNPIVGGSSAPVGDGTLTISVGATSFDVEIAEDATLADVRDAINNATTNAGVRATILNGADGARLVLTASKTGSEQAIEISASGGDGGLSAFAFDPDAVDPLGMQQTQPAQNALIKVATFDIESSTNTFADAIDGVTITVKKESEPGETFALDVEFDSATVQSNITKFVTEYNNLHSQLARLSSYNAETRSAGPLLGDSLLRGVQSDLRRGLSDPIQGVEGVYGSLASIGIKTTTTGTLEIDKDKLKLALETEPENVAKVFGSENGVAARLHKQMENHLGSSSDVETRTKRLNDDIKSIAKEKEALALRMEEVQARYRRQFSALDSLLSQMQNTSSYLAQQLANLPQP
jgi:flagellar hook-associated protein 2